MSELRVSAIAHYAEEGHPNPVLVARDADGALKPVARAVLCKGEHVAAELKDAGMVLVMETEE